jgi:DNA helicase II / ATP-dependent DNA helicase PcrA
MSAFPLNPPQVEAVHHYLGPILILAGAGSGKTRVLTHRIEYLISQYKEAPSSILAVTFTNKATEEMRNRIAALLGQRGKDVWVATFHSASLRILRRYADVLGYTPDFAVYDEQDSRTVMKRALKELGIGTSKDNPAPYLRFVDNLKNNYQEPSDDFKGSHYRDYVAAYRRYQELLMASNAMDFGDLIYNVVKIFILREDILEQYQRRLKFVLVDEFQDTNPVQYILIKKLSEVHRNILVVGDDDQSIYKFRGAHIGNILNFEVDYPHTKVVKLEQNYRSTSTILEASHAVIERNRTRKEKKLWTEQGEGELIKLVTTPDEYDEAQFIAKETVMLRSSGVPLNEIAVFYRTNAQSRAIEDAFLSTGVPYRIYGGLKFYDRKEVKDILSYLRVLLNPSDLQSFVRASSAPSRGIGPQTIRELESVSINERGEASYISALRITSRRSPGVRELSDLFEGLEGAADILTPDLLIDEVVNKSRYLEKLRDSGDPADQSRIENLVELRSFARENTVRASQQGIAHPKEQLRFFLDRVALSSQEEGDEEGRIEPKVSLMTVHLAKGLEFHSVFFSGLEEGLAPHYRALDELRLGDRSGLEEERRLFYVAMTRAKSLLYMSYALERGMMSSAGSFGYNVGFGGARARSQFIEDIPKKCFSTIQIGGRRAPAFDQSFHDESNDKVYEKSVYLDAPIVKRKKTPELLKASELADTQRAKAHSLPSYSKGNRVHHKMFGEGTVIDVEGEKKERMRVTVDFDKGGRRRLIALHAPLSLLE